MEYVTNYLDSFNGWGVTLIDGLDTMWIMGLHEEFYEAIPIVANMTFAQDTVSNHMIRSSCSYPEYTMIEIIRSLLRDCHSLSRRAAVRIRSLRRADIAYSCGRSGTNAPACIKHDVGIAYVCGEYGDVCMRASEAVIVVDVVCSGETREGWTHGTVLWAEALSCQLEYKYLAHLTGRREYFEDVRRSLHPAQHC